MPGRWFRISKPHVKEYISLRMEDSCPEQFLHLLHVALVAAFMCPGVHLIVPVRLALLSRTSFWLQSRHGSSSAERDEESRRCPSRPEYKVTLQGGQGHRWCLSTQTLSPTTQLRAAARSLLVVRVLGLALGVPKRRKTGAPCVKYTERGSSVRSERLFKRSATT
jgi:hypothetical protein